MLGGFGCDGLNSVIVELSGLTAGAGCASAQWAHAEAA